MGKSHKTGGNHHSKKPVSAKKKDKEKSNKEKKVVKGSGGGNNNNKTQKSPKSATAKKKGTGDGKSDKSKKQQGNDKKHSAKPKSGKEKSGKEKTTKHSKPQKKEEPVESGTSTAEEVDEVEVPAKQKVVKAGAPKKTIDPETSEPVDCSCETKQSSGGGGGGQQSSAGTTSTATGASSAADEQATIKEATMSSAAEETSDDADSPKAADKKKNHKSKQPKEKEKEKKPKSKNSSPKLEFTKPTINQMVREEERQKHPKPPLVDTPDISRYDFEAFNDEVEEMNSGLMMLRSSYGSIITSLVAMYTKRGKRGQKAQLPPTVDGKANLLTPINAAAGADGLQEEASILNDADKYNIDNFINPATRQASFDALFAEVELLNRKTEKFRTAFFDKKGYFLLEKYEAQKEMKLSRKKLNHFWLW
ncbi:PREDICTED: glutamic acid-rich protein-like, partial [Rhagoletis zephyria]|uniref:glutamic acid-rich protein-like n=1 Tax=Rhagoletis zephyria TaxID=28612 RepID=UPI0008112A46